MKVNVFIGRFQPFHNGHAAAIDYVLERSDAVVVVVGSAQKNHELDNPFTAGERVEMIMHYLNWRKPDKPVYPIPLDDIINHNLWICHLRSYLPRFDEVYSNNALVHMLASEAGIKVIPVPLVEREELMATRIRERILKGERWDHLVPKPVYDFIIKINGEERIRAIAKSKEDVHTSKDSSR